MIHDELIDDWSNLTSWVLGNYFNDLVLDKFNWNIFTCLSVSSTGSSDISNIDEHAQWIKASLCDGEDDRSIELAQALIVKNMDETTHKECLNIRARIEDIVLALHRVEKMKSRLTEIFSAVIDQESNDD